MRWITSRVLLAACLVLLDGRARAAADTRPNLLVIVIDAQRADHLSSYGYGRATSPRLDAFFARGVRFTNAIAASNRTSTSMASFWTGQMPLRHGVFRRGDVLPERFTTLAEILGARGYRTAAWCPNPSLDRKLGHAQGWQDYDDDIMEDDGGPAWQRWETARAINAAALPCIAAKPQQPFLAWLHYRDVHGPYVPPPPYDTMFPATATRPMTPAEIAARPGYLTLAGDGDDLQYYVSRYDGDVRYADEKIAQLLAELERGGVLEHTVVVITADHGEAFLDHGQWNHDETLYEEELHVPLVIVRPGTRPHVVERVVSSLDLFPTLLELGGAPAVPSDGQSLVPLLDGDDARYRRTRAYSQSRGRWGSIQQATRDARWKVLFNDSYAAWFLGRPLELYDLQADPGEKSNLAWSNRAQAKQLAEEHRAAVLAPLAPGAPEASRPADA
ncbi:sulfatase-like hydrolase/transferase, partial [Candidatus Binatia bacterium]|nr:sulfatase-like hydrolase/transferase [Candidatus Binatia bacterium]